MYGFYIGKPNSKMSCIQQNFPSKFEPNDAFYEKLEENTFVAFILKHPVCEKTLPLPTGKHEGLWPVMDDSDNYKKKCCSGASISLN